MTQSLEELTRAYQAAERRLRELLLGDGLYSPGAVRGDEQRRAVNTQLRQLRRGLDAAVELIESERRAVEPSIDDDLRSATRRTKGRVPER